MHTTDSHGGIKVCDSSHEAISYPALCYPSMANARARLEDTSDEMRGMCTAVVSQTKKGFFLCRRSIRMARIVGLLFQWELRHSTWRWLSWHLDADRGLGQSTHHTLRTTTEYVRAHVLMC